MPPKLTLLPRAVWFPLLVAIDDSNAVADSDIPRSRPTEVRSEDSAVGAVPMSLLDGLMSRLEGTEYPAATP